MIAITKPLELVLRHKAQQIVLATGAAQPHEMFCFGSITVFCSATYSAQWWKGASMSEASSDAPGRTRQRFAAIGYLLSPYARLHDVSARTVILP